MHRSRVKLIFLAVGIVATTAGAGLAFAQSPAETTPPEHQRSDPQQQAPTVPLQKQSTAAELSAKDTRLGIANIAIWHCADHYGIVPPASRPNPPEIKD
jgi:hypothetical protein